MRYNKFGQTDLVASELGLGSQSLGGGLYYRNDRVAPFTAEELAGIKTATGRRDG